jgi:hypothetical protein
MKEQKPYSLFLDSGQIEEKLFHEKNDKNINYCYMTKSFFQDLFYY